MMKKTIACLLLVTTQALPVKVYSSEKIILREDMVKSFNETADQLINIFKMTARVSYSDAETDDIYIKRSLDVVRKDMLDPDAAKFRNIELMEMNSDNDIKYVCGEVNGKNAYGAYVGYREFVSNGSMMGERYISKEDLRNKFLVIMTKRYDDLCKADGK